MKLLVLAGGKGSRLKKEVPHLPKALAPINDIPFIDFQMENWIKQGVKSFVFILHYEYELIQKHLSQKYSEMVNDGCISFVIESTPLDTGGAVKNAISELDITENFLLINADTWLGDGLFNIWINNAPSMGIIKVEDISRYGEVKFDKNIVTSFEEKSGINKSGYINAGISCLDPKSFEMLDLKIFSLEKDFFPKLLKKDLLQAVKLNADFIDIGIPSDYNRFCKWIESNKKNIL